MGRAQSSPEHQQAPSDPESQVILVERTSADSEGRWARALDLLLEAGRAVTTEDED